MRRTCRQCSNQFDLDYRGGRPRERCYSCQPAGTRATVPAPKPEPTPRAGPITDLARNFTAHFDGDWRAPLVDSLASQLDGATDARDIADITETLLEMIKWLAKDDNDQPERRRRHWPVLT